MSLYDVTGNEILQASGTGYAKVDHKVFPPHFNLDIDNGKLASGYLGYDKFPGKTFKGGSLTVIAPNLSGMYLNNKIDIVGGEVVSTLSYVDVNDTKYVLIRFDYDIDTDLTPETATGSWRIINFDLAASKGFTNENVWIVADIPLEDIDAEFISAECITESVSTDFVNAVRVANKSDGVAADVSSLKGKVWLAFGDSYTRYLAGLYTDGVTPSTGGEWGKLAGNLGMTLYSYGIVGSTIRFSMNTGSDGHSWQPMVSRVDDLIADHQHEADNVGLITFMGGTNDGWTDERIGTIMSQEKETIAGSCHQIFNKLSNAFPNAKIIVILQPVRGDGTNPGTDVDGRDTSGFDNMQYNLLQSVKKQRVVKEVAEFYGLTICDCCFDWYTTANPRHLSLIWDSSDKLHLTSVGNQKLTEKLIKTLEATFV